jgi:superfamily II DNA or RNA helicase
MNNILKKDVVQKKALKAWVDSGKKSSVEITTGVGKTFISLHALYEMPLDWSVEHFFFAEVVDRKLDLIKQIKLYNQIFDRNVLKDYNLHFVTYQGSYKWKGVKIGLGIFDEVHELCTPEYSKLYYNNHFKATIGLSATIDSETYYPSINRFKIDILNDIAPICYTYSLDDGLKDNTSRQLDIYVIYNELNTTDKLIKAGSKTKVFYQTEKAAYDYWNKSFIKNVSQFIEYSM